MGFQILLVLLFFSILYFKPSSLYAPSDFRSDESFLKVLKDCKERIIKEKVIKSVGDIIPEKKLSNKVSQSVLDSINQFMALDKIDLIALKIINDNKSISSNKIQELAKAQCSFINGGMLTGLEHDELIKGHIGKNKYSNSVTITIKGLKLINEFI